MKRLLFLFTFIAASLFAWAQNNNTRVLIHETNGNVKGYLVERVDSIDFVKIAGAVSVEAKFLKYSAGADGDTIWAAFQRSADCFGYRFSIVPKVLADKLENEMQYITMVERSNNPLFTEDFTNAQMTGIGKLKDNTNYTILVAAYDKYGIACTAQRVDFTTPRKTLVGSPKITATVVETKTDNLTVKFTPNSDVAGYGVCLFEKGQAEAQFEQWGPMMGFANMGDMIKRFSGKDHIGEENITWNGLKPNTEYEIYALPWDTKGTYADMAIVYATTKKLGGEGVAKVEIEIKEFGGTSEGYWQRVIYTPNDQSSLHRDIIMDKEVYDQADKGEAYVLKLLKEDHPQDPYWDQFGVDDVKWNAEPNKTYIAFSIAKNAKDEWGPLASKQFTTPAQPSGLPKAVKAATRIVTTTYSGPTQPFGKLMPVQKGDNTIRLQAK